MRGRRIGLTILLAALAPLLAPAWQQAGAQGPCRVALPAGDVQGQNLGASCAFLGIPFGATTAGDNRWRAPKPAAPWAPLVLNATIPATGCPTLGAFQPPTASGTEDCLRMNVWVVTPPPDAPAPVIVWLHTGAFTGGSANFAGSNGRRLAERTGVIVVAPNYRLGPLGFLAHPSLAAEMDGIAGNYGLLDQQAALRWVRDNIAWFGGNPANVTLAGTSAGGQSVGMHLVAPGSSGLFHRAILQSAHPTSRWNTRAEAFADGNIVAASLGCIDSDPAAVVACLRSKPVAQVLTAAPVGTQQVMAPPGRLFWEPIVDGSVIPEQPRLLLETGGFNAVPTIVGFNRDEGWGPFVNRSFTGGVDRAQYEAWVSHEFGAFASSVLELYPSDEDPLTTTPSPLEAMARVTGDVQFVCEARRLARAIERTGTRTYVYSYEHEIDTLSPGHVIHGIESNVLFGNDYLPPIFPSYALGPLELALHEAMHGYWSRFAATGDPNQDDAIHWPAFRHPTGPGRGADKYLVLQVPPREHKRSREAQCDLFEPLFLRSVLGARPAAAP